jgi:hypothetical protein
VHDLALLYNIACIHAVVSPTVTCIYALVLTHALAGTHALASVSAVMGSSVAGVVAL